MAGYYYSTNARVTFENPLSCLASDDETGLLNQRIQNHIQVPPLTNHYSTYRDNQCTSTPRMAKPHSESREGNPNQNEIMTKKDRTNPEEDDFNKSFLPLLNDQQCVQ